MLKNTVNKQNIWKAIVGALVVLVVLDLTPIGGNTAVYVKWAQCGGSMPLQTGHRVFHEVPYYTSTPPFMVVRGLRTYFCTAEQAENAGYSSDPDSYTFPHLPKSEWQDSIQKARKIVQE